MDPVAFKLRTKLCFGDKIIIRYNAPEEYPQFSINLVDKSNDIILHFNPRYENDVNNNKKLVLNNCINKKWQKEVWHNVTDDLRGEKTVVIDAQPHAFMITAADDVIYDFPMRVPVMTCTGINIVNGIFINVEHQDLSARENVIFTEQLGEKPVKPEYVTVAQFPDSRK